MKVVVIGGNAAGMSAASRIKRKQPEVEVVVLESTYEVAFGACGLPYYVSGANPNVDLIRIRKAPEFMEAGIDLKMGYRVTQVSDTEKVVSGVTHTGETFSYSYDYLVVASGARANMPPIPGIKQPGIYTMKTIQDAENLKEALISGEKDVVIVGGGYIGMEIAEACIMQKAKSLRIIEFEKGLLSTFDPEFGKAVLDRLIAHGVSVHLEERVEAFEVGDKGVSAVTTNKGSYPCDIVVMSVGAVPNTEFLPNSVEKIRNGAIVTDSSMRSSVADIFAVGDCATVWHKLLQKPMYIPLGTNANKQGRIVGDVILGKPACFERALGTAMIRCLDIEMAKTGLSEKEAIAHGIPVKTKMIQTRSHSRYYPNPSVLSVKICYNSESKVLLGAQIMGEHEAAIRINVFALAIDQGMTGAELGLSDFGYAPPFATVWDAVAIAANVL